MANPKINIESIEAVPKEGKIEISISCVISLEEKESVLDEVIEKNITASPPKQKTEKVEKRIDSDQMEEPPISELIARDLGACVESIKSRQEGHELNCMIIGSFTANWARVISEKLPVSGGRILCIGDCVSENGKADQSWKDTVGEDFGKTIFPVSGDIDEHVQGIDKKPDLIMMSVCGEYAEVATMINRWSGLIMNGGIVCGPQFDKEDYPASTDAIIDIFGKDRVKSSTKSSFWYVDIQNSHVK